MVEENGVVVLQDIDEVVNLDLTGPFLIKGLHLCDQVAQTQPTAQLLQLHLHSVKVVSFLKVSKCFNYVRVTKSRSS